ncbi:MAG: putative addiction module antidote protein [Nitrospinae bacterium]|nr:putative addiction module antidote protein [Nitrospinota bacterium]
MRTRRKSRAHDDVIVEHLRANPEEAAEYLNASLAEDDPRMFLVALRDVVKAFGGMKHAAEKAGLNRESLYKALSGKRHPRISSVNFLLRAMGFALEIKIKGKKPVKRKTTQTRGLVKSAGANPVHVS